MQVFLFVLLASLAVLAFFVVSVLAAFLVPFLAVSFIVWGWEKFFPRRRVVLFN